MENVGLAFTAIQGRENDFVLLATLNNNHTEDEGHPEELLNFDCD